MQYNGEINNQDIVSGVRFVTKADENAYTIKDLTRNANMWYQKAISLIQGADGTWQYDDANNTTLPIATSDLVSGQKDYSLDDELLEIERLEVKNAEGEWTKLKPIDRNEIEGAVENYMSEDGTPVQYDKVGRSLMLYPAPNYASTDGMKVYFKRGANIFDTTDIVKEPGFADKYHQYIVYGASLEYAKYFKPELVNVLIRDIELLEIDMKKFYGRRKGDNPLRMRANIESTK